MADVDLTERQVRVLKVLAEHQGERLGAGYIWRLAFGDEEPYRGRRDAGMTSTLDSLWHVGKLVSYSYGRRSAGRDWAITQAGLDALGSLPMTPEQQHTINELSRCFASGQERNDLKWRICKPYARKSHGGDRPNDDPLTVAEADELIAKLRAAA